MPDRTKDNDRKSIDDRTRADKIGGKIIVLSVALGLVWWSITSLAPEPEEVRRHILAEQPRPDAQVFADSRSCAEDHRACQDEWEFRRQSSHYFHGREACKAAAAREAREHAADGYRGMTGVIDFGPDPFEQLAYIDWKGMLAENAMVMKDEELKLQVYGSAWAEGRAVCSFDFDTGEAKHISVGFD